MNTPRMIYKMMWLNSADLIIPRDTYQRELRNARAAEIANNFSEYIANEPKVSFRDGKYFVFDGQHTIVARKARNGGEDLMILCKVYSGLTEQKEAELFAAQTGFSAKVYPGAKTRALVVAEDQDALSFLCATQDAGLRLSYNQIRGQNQIGCVAAAYRQFRDVGVEIYTEALGIIVAAWDGHKDSLRAETIQGVTQFVKLYHDEYDPKRLISRCRRCDPMHIYRSSKAAGDSLPVPQRYIFEVWKIYNGSSKVNALPLKF